MLTHRLAWLLMLLVYFISPANAQTPRAAQDFYNRGNQRYNKGDLDGAIADFTRAIEISSSLDPQRNQERKTPSDLGRVISSFNRITVIDPFTALAYTNRGLARSGQGDFDGALADFNRAI